MWVSLAFAFVGALALAWGVAELLPCGSNVVRNSFLLGLGLVSATAWFASASISLALVSGTVRPHLSFHGNAANLVAALTTGMCAFIQNVPLSGMCS
jgi:hypothetical protein